jgi:hypothetical protein
VPADLSSDEFGRVAAVMLRLHADFRRRHDLPPLPTAAVILQRLEDLKRRSALNDPAVLRSPRAGIGGALEAARWVLWKILKPVFDRQTEANQDLLLAMEILAVESILTDRSAMRDREQELLERVAELERRLARLPEGLA